MSPFIIAIILFAVTYVLLFTLPKIRSYIALCSAVVFSVWLTFFCADIEFGLGTVLGAIDFNILMMIAGTMGIVTLFIESRLPMRIADVMLSKFGNVKMAIVAMAVLAGVVSAFVDNVATVLMIAPIALAVCKKQNMAPVPAIISIAVSSNLQGAATLVGDTTSILLGAAAGIKLNSPYHAGAIRNRANMGVSNTFPIWAYSFGDVGFVAAPYEMFDTNGVYIKENSPFAYTFISTIANKTNGYFPSDYGFSYGCYEVDTTNYVRGSAERLADEYIRMLTEQFDNQ